MIFKKSTLITLISCLLFLLSSERSAAQCEHTGQVVEPTNSQTCGKLILSYDTWELLVPTNDTLLAGVAVSEEILFSYAPDSIQTPACLAGPAIQLLCVAPLIPPNQDCEVDFHYTIDFGGPLPVAFFEPSLIDYSASYLWDFGDGTTSTEHAASHTFASQGKYDVCLRISGGVCPDSTTVCHLIDLEECHASFQYTASNGVVHFINQSSGNYVEWNWSLGDGSNFHNTEPGSHDYGETNIYTVCLEVWNNNGCSSKFCNYVYTDSGDICEFAACVYPGDTNEDGAANVYDLLPIGVGFGSEGPPRQVENVGGALDWSAQYAPDWGLETIAGNDYKHLDCNGDGEIDGDDAIAIEANYAAPENIFFVQSPGAPTFWLDFEWDTILINDNTPAFIKLEADLMAGTPSQPMQNVTGFALQIDYPEELVKLDGVEVDYHDNAFLGHSNQIIWLQKDRQDGGVMDLGIVKKGTEASGFGKVATLSFIVISDVLGRTTETETFTVALSDVVAVNGEGAMLTVGPVDSATVHIVNKTTATSTSQASLQQRAQLFPNPVSSTLSVLLPQLRAESLMVFNSLGQRIFTGAGFTDATTINVEGWQPGLYLVKIKTDRGVVNKTVVVQR